MPNIKTVEPVAPVYGEQFWEDNPGPEDIIRIQQWGNRYYLEDCVKHKCIRLDSDMYCKMLQQLECLMKTVQMNMSEV